MVGCDFSSLTQEEFVFPNMPQKGVAVLALTDHSGIIPPLPTKRMKKMYGSWQNISAQILLSSCIVYNLSFKKTWSQNSKHLSKCIFSFEGSEFSYSPTSMAPLKVVWQIISSKVGFVP